MKRRPFHTAAALSLLLCVATVVLWVRSRRINDVVYYYGDTQLFELHQVHGMVLTGWGEKQHKELAGWAHGAHRARRRNIYESAWRSHGGFSAYREAMSMNCYSANVWRVLVPHWFLAAVFAILPTGSVVAMFRGAARLQNPGICRACGYDLRATPKRCPECGLVTRG